jgi:LacI family transcriptional regulator
VATIADVARKAGVSVSTVSHVLNGTRRVAPNTARAVQDVIDSFGYKPNILARSLKAASTRSVGIALSSITNPYFVDIISAIETECARLGMMMFLSDTEDDPARELEVVMALHQRRVDGIILAPSADPDRRALAYLREARLPCVLVDRMRDPEFDQVGVNNREAMRLLVEHVAARGHERIGYVGGHPGFETTLERIAGYRDGVTARGAAVDERLLVTDNATTAGSASCVARSADSPGRRQQSDHDRNHESPPRARVARAEGYFRRRLRRFRMGRLFRAAFDACRSALRGDRQTRSLSAHGAHRGP